jgi:hypothetical protein
LMVWKLTGLTSKNFQVDICYEDFLVVTRFMANSVMRIFWTYLHLVTKCF